MNDVAGLEFPALLAGGEIDRVQISVAATEIDRALCDYRARKIDIVGVGDRLGFRQHAVEIFCFEPPLAFGSEFPFQLPILCIECVELPVIASDVNDAIDDGGRARHRSASRSFPNLAATLGINRVNISVVST